MQSVLILFAILFLIVAIVFACIWFANRNKPRKGHSEGMNLLDDSRQSGDIEVPRHAIN